MCRTRIGGVLLFLSCLITTNSLAQQRPVSVGFGAEVVSRYVVRGLSFGHSPSVQPSVAVSAVGFDVGTWGNYALTGASDGNNAEQDFWLGYTFDHPRLGTLRLSAFDFHFPGGENGFFDLSGQGDGSHFLEAQLRYQPAHLPLYLFAGHHVYNDPDRSWYVELGYTTSLKDLDVTVSTGAAGAGSAWYGTPSGGPSVINATLGLKRTIPLSEHFSLPLHANFVLNPNTEQAYLVFGFSL